MLREVAGDLAFALHDIESEEHRKKAEKGLLVSEARYRMLFDNASDGIISRDFEGNIIMANDAMAKLTGYATDELTGMNIAQIFSASGLERAMKKQRALLADGKESSSDRYEIRLIRKDKTERIGEAVTSLLMSEGQPLGILATIRDVTEQRRVRDSIRAYASQITQAQEEERKRIARDLHDETIQDLASLAMDIDHIVDTGQGLHDHLAQNLGNLRSKTTDILENVRRFSQDLRPPVLEALGLIEALQWLIDDFEGKQNVGACLEVNGIPRRFAPESELLLFRIAQEALNNVRKHSQAIEVLVTVEFSPSSVKLSITDDGQGFTVPEFVGDYTHSGKLGLMGMQERARLLSGTLTILSELGKRTTITADVPI